MAAFLTGIFVTNGGATVIAAVIALIGAIVGVSASALVSRRSAFINAVTAERSKWIDKLRLNLADYYSATTNLHLLALQVPASSKTFEASPDLVREVDKLGSLIRLQLNPRGSIDQNIILLLGVIPKIAKSRDDLEAASNLLILHSQWLLKEEWEKVKQESGGIVGRWRGVTARKGRAAEYEKFCESIGSLAKVRRLDIRPQ